MDRAQDIVKAFARIADDFANLEVGKAPLERLETRNGLEILRFFIARFFYQGLRAEIESSVAETLDLVGLADQSLSACREIKPPTLQVGGFFFAVLRPTWHTSTGSTHNTVRAQPG